MPSRTIPFVNNHFYHIFNRGVAHMPIFNTKWDHKRFTKTFFYYQIKGPKPKFSIFSPDNNKLDTNNKIVELICYCLMPNHFHFLLQQKVDGGITEFVSKISNSYTKYFNTKNERAGPILQGEFKSVLVETNEQLVHLSRYIHLNPLVSYLTDNLELYPLSSYLEYIGINKTSVCSKDIIVKQFKSSQEYKQFVLDQENYGKELERIKHQTLDLPK
ncbi:hypothetical protein A3A48_01020 [Candidatus Curtissbacteria bacterium RIFCSPLOWO2_01_FULL_37_9]|uniref:Transposase IS200-like domain-containing protein n=1 Tax=Candidatus Curtissbacteria bacterium RIFCSPLOWO2_01_FULL_37_9 TaxID=1797724 RepID=A0A1F5GUT7_9BACT|nr:MAG: hypothetical protein A3A48_01020 [Candidatus Curtissbacteria bacterium RIFCSPLOWO2_01_FULL_37_9]